MLLVLAALGVVAVVSAAVTGVLRVLIHNLFAEILSIRDSHKVTPKEEDMWAIDNAVQTITKLTVLVKDFNIVSITTLILAAIVIVLKLAI